MRYEVTNEQRIKIITNEKPELAVVMGDARLSWILTEYKAAKFTPEMMTFTHINRFISELPLTTQQTLFARIKDCNDVLEGCGSAEELYIALRPLVDEIYRLPGMDPVTAKNWAERQHDILIHPRFEKIYVESDEKHGNREQTYTHDDYIHLVGMAILLRIMIPIWSQYLSMTANELGPYYKFKQAFQLIHRTNLAECAAMMKVRRYIEFNLRPGRSMTSSILVGISSEDYIDWVLAKTVVERICVGDIRGYDTSPGMVIDIYNHISPLTTDGSRTQGQFGGHVTPKIMSTDEESARLEQYKGREDITIGEVVPYNVFMTTQYVNLAQRICPGTSPELVERLVQHNRKVFEKHTIENGQLTLMQWVLSNIEYFDGDPCFTIEARAADYYNLDATVCGLSVAQAVLIETGHYRLAYLISSVRYENTSGIQRFNGANSISRITKEQMTALNELFPYSYIPQSKPKAKVTNHAIESIEVVTTMFQQSEWQVTLPTDIYARLTDNPAVTRVSSPYDIKTCLADLAIQVARSDWKIKNT
jgi:hypothetical protein